MSELRAYSAIDTRVTLKGRPLSEIGLEGASIVHPDGSETPLTGVLLDTWTHPKKTLAEHVRDALERQYPGCKLVIPL